MERIKRFTASPGGINRFLILAAIYSLLPFLYLARYNYPVADDYGYAKMFSQQGLGTLLRNQYLGWSGRYLMPVIYRLDPTCFYSLSAYRVFSFFMLFLFVAIAFGVIRNLTREFLGFPQSAGLTALFLCLYLSKAPGIAEAFYWFSSYSIYQTANLCMLLLVMALVRLGRTTSPGHEAPAGRRPLLVLWSCFLCFVIIGCNEVSLLITVFFFFFYMVHRSVANKGPVPYLLVLFILCLVFAVIEIAAPGNFSRLGETRKTARSILWTLTGSISITAVYSSQWVYPLLAASVVYIPFFGAPIARKMALAGRSFDISFRGFLGFFVVTFCFLPVFTVWVAKGSDVGRIFDVIYFFVLLSWFFLIQLLLNNYHNRFSFPLSWGWLGLVLFLASQVDIDNNVSTAYVDIFSGKALAYDQALASRATAVRACKTDTCYVPALPDAPRTLFFTDLRPLSDRSGLWINYYYSQYWHAGFVVPDGPPPVPSANREALRNIGKSIRTQLLKN